ncbi:MAG: PDZ domain-containing protein [Rhodospirillales bacterium]|nr:PDZ domain-containing protein [Rhodospirillales bacterium]MBO6785828.1 PDZ domain-containing protein [Rhodospirillales bacterium]
MCFFAARFRPAQVFGIVALYVIAFGATCVNADERGFLGMQVQGNSPKIAAAMGIDTAIGVLVRDISVDGPAATAGIARGDIILSLHGVTLDTFERLVQVAGELRAGDEIDVLVLRLGKKIKLKMAVSGWPDGWQIEKSAFAAQPDLGLTFAALTPKLRKHLGIRWGSVGIVVSVFNDMFAGVTPLRRGDVVLQVNQQRVWQPQQFLDAYAKAKEQGRPSLLLLVERNDGFKYILQPIVSEPIGGPAPPAFKLPGQQGG